MDLRWPSGPSSVVSGRSRGLRLESTQAHFQKVVVPSDLPRSGGFPFPANLGSLSIRGVASTDLPAVDWPRSDVAIGLTSSGGVFHYRYARLFGQRAGRFGKEVFEISLLAVP